MPPTNRDFAHLQITKIVTARAWLRGGGQKAAQTKENERRREEHSRELSEQASNVSSTARASRAERQRRNLPSLPAGTPILVQVDPEADVDFLRSAFNLEIVSEQEDGFVIVSSEDVDLTQLRERISAFSEGASRSGTVAKVYSLRGQDALADRLQRIVSDKLLQDWAAIGDETHIVDVSIECLGTVFVPKHPERSETQTDASWRQSRERWEAKRNEAYAKWDELKSEREDQLMVFVKGYGGEITQMVDGVGKGFFELPDSFSARIKISGHGLKDLAANFPYVFDISEPPEVDTALPPLTPVLEVPVGATIEPPESDDPRVCVIDSGIQEEHALLRAAIDTTASRSYVPNDTDVADKVPGGGHGTRVAGAVLYPDQIPTSGTVKLRHWIQNARILDGNNCIPKKIFPPKLLSMIVEQYGLAPERTRIFNHSVSSKYPCRLKHMSAWAAAIDNLSCEHDVLFIQASGNLPFKGSNQLRPGVADHLLTGKVYPNYLLQPSARIADPAQSLHALTVGSLALTTFSTPDAKSLAKQHEPSSFSASGFGIWDVIKPEVVEYGGDFVVNESPALHLSTPAVVCPSLVRSTRTPPSPAWAKDAVGTSFSAPKVAAIAADIQRAFPDEPTTLYRALVVQSARWPSWAEQLPLGQLRDVIRKIGYGLPDRGRACEGSEHRITLITRGATQIQARQAQIYQVHIPQEIRRPALEQRIRIEVTLAYLARPRRTRRRLRNYLSTWVDWKSSNFGEPPNSFSHRMLLEDMGGGGGAYPAIPWTLGDRVDTGKIMGVRRNSGTVQKDWADISAFNLPEHFSIAVIGHPGWDPDPEATASYSLAVSFEALDRDISIYEPIRAQLEMEVETEVEAQV